MSNKVKSFGAAIVKEKVSLSKFTTLYGISSHQTNLFQVNFWGGLHSKSEGKVENDLILVL